MTRESILLCKSFELVGESYLSGFPIAIIIRAHDPNREQTP
jgi:hypothetical protein